MICWKTHIVSTIRLISEQVHSNSEVPYRRRRVRKYALSIVTVGAAAMLMTTFEEECSQCNKNDDVVHTCNCLEDATRGNSDLICRVHLPA